MLNLAQSRYGVVIGKYDFNFFTFHPIFLWRTDAVLLHLKACGEANVPKQKQMKHGLDLTDSVQRG